MTNDPIYHTLDAYAPEYFEELELPEMTRSAIDFHLTHLETALVALHRLFVDPDIFHDFVDSILDNARDLAHDDFNLQYPLVPHGTIGYN